MSGSRWRSRLVVLVAALLLAGGATACTTTLTGTGRPAAGASGRSATGSPTSSPSATAVVTTPAELADLLMDVPTDADQDTSSWADNRTPTIDEFVKVNYPEDPTRAAAYLRGLGVVAIAHVGWTAPGDTAAELVLFLFDDEDGAYTWMSGETSALREAGALRATLDDVPAAVGYTFTQPTAAGSRDTRYYATKGRIGTSVDYFTDDPTDPGEVGTWFGTQLDRLP